jgi:hypothetical protein
MSRSLRSAMSRSSWRAKSIRTRVIVPTL